jgi:hypothetical protein
MQGGSVHHNTRAMVDLQPSLGRERERDTYCYIVEEHDGVNSDKCLIIQHSR